MEFSNHISNRRGKSGPAKNVFPWRWKTSSLTKVKKEKTLTQWSLWAQRATPAGSHPQPRHLKIHGSKITVGSDYNPNRTKICTNVTLLMLGIHCYHHLCNVTSTIILVCPWLGLPGAWNSHVACLERTKQETDHCTQFSLSWWRFYLLP